MSLLLLLGTQEKNQVKFWNGTRWALKAAKIWDGSIWIKTTVIKIRSEDEWVDVKI